MEISKMIYKKEKNKDNIRIFGETFVKNNRNKVKLIIKNRKSHLKDILSVININEDIIKIKMILNRYTCDFSCIFKDCKSLKYITKFLIDSSIDNFIFKENDNTTECSEEIIKSDDDSSSSSISEISQSEGDNSESSKSVLLLMDKIVKNFFIKNHIIIKEMFNNCKSLLSLPDISNWNTDKAIDMSKMFYNCESLQSLPDISRWNTDNVIYMNNMFYNCRSLESLPDISKWNTNNVIYMNSMFSDCQSLKSIPDISKWNINNVIYMNSMFYNCQSLKSIPDISKLEY